MKKISIGKRKKQSPSTFTLLAYSISGFVLIFFGITLKSHMMTANMNNPNVLGVATTHHVSLGFGDYIKIGNEVGYINSLKLMLTPDAKKSVVYHTFDNPKDPCIAPNFWAVDDMDALTCLQISKSIPNIKCGIGCNSDYATGATCPLGHKCCRPGGEVYPNMPPPQQQVPVITPSPTLTPFFKGNCDASAGTIQYCGLQF